MTHPGNALLILCLAAIAVLATIAVIGNSIHGLTVPAPGLGTLGDLPWTRHAQDAHKGQAWNVGAIVEMMSRRSCSPIYVYSCPAQWEVRYLCPAERGGDLWLGLIVGYKTINNEAVVITGYAARSSFWLKAMADDGCTLWAQIP